MSFDVSRNVSNRGKDILLALLDDVRHGFAV